MFLWNSGTVLWFVFCQQLSRMGMASHWSIANLGNSSRLVTLTSRPGLSNKIIKFDQRISAMFSCQPDALAKPHPGYQSHPMKLIISDSIFLIDSLLPRFCLFYIKQYSIQYTVTIYTIPWRYNFFWCWGSRKFWLILTHLTRILIKAIGKKKYFFFLLKDGINQTL